MIISPWNLLKEATKQVPAIKYLVALCAFAAVIAIVQAWQISFRVAVWGAVVMLALSVVLIVFAKLSTIPNLFVRRPAMVLMWFCVLLFMTVCSLLVLCVFFRRPVDLGDWLKPIETENSPRASKPTSGPIAPSCASAARMCRDKGDALLGAGELRHRNDQYRLAWAKLTGTSCPSADAMPERADDVVQSLASSDERNELAYIVCGFGELCVQQGEFDCAQKLLDTAGRLFARLPSPEAGGLDRVSLANEGLIARRCASDKESIGRKLECGDRLIESGEPLAALAEYEAAKTIADKSSCVVVVERIRSFVGQGDSLRIAEQLGAARKRYDEAVNLADKSDAEQARWWAYAIRGLAAIEGVAPERKDSALKTLTDAETVFVRQRDERGRALVELTRVLIYLNAGDLRGAGEVVNTIEKKGLAAALSPRERAYLRWHEADIATTRNDFNSSETRLRQAIGELAGRPNDKLLIQLEDELINVLVEQAERAHETPKVLAQKCDEAFAVLLAAGHVPKDQDPVAYLQRRLVAGRVESCRGQLSTALDTWTTPLQEMVEIQRPELSWYDHAKFRQVRSALELALARGHVQYAVQLASRTPCDVDCWNAVESHLTEARGLLEVLDVEIGKETGLLRQQLGQRVKDLWDYYHETCRWLDGKEHGSATKPA